VSADVDYRLLDRFLQAHRRNSEGRYDAAALERLRSVVELRRDAQQDSAAAAGGAVLRLPLHR